MSVTDEDSELRDVLAKTLENAGVLGKFRAQLRASVFLALEEPESEKNINIVNEDFVNFAKTTDGNLIISLFVDFLKFFNLDYTLSVFEPEAAFPKEPLSREALCKKLNVKDVGSNKQQPVMCQLLTLLVNSNNHSLVGRKDEDAEMEEGEEKFDLDKLLSEKMSSKKSTNDQQQQPPQQPPQQPQQQPPQQQQPQQQQPTENVGGRQVRTEERDIVEPESHSLLDVAQNNNNQTNNNKKMLKSKAVSEDDDEKQENDEDDDEKQENDDKDDESSDDSSDDEDTNSSIKIPLPNDSRKNSDALKSPDYDSEDFNSSSTTPPLMKSDRGLKELERINEDNEIKTNDNKIKIHRHDSNDDDDEDDDDIKEDIMIENNDDDDDGDGGGGGSSTNRSSSSSKNDEVTTDKTVSPSNLNNVCDYIEDVLKSL